MARNESSQRAQNPQQNIQPFAYVFIFLCVTLFIIYILFSITRTGDAQKTIPALITPSSDVQNININDPNSNEMVEFNSIRVPLENCNGSDVLQTTYKDAQTFTYDYTVDWSSGLSLSISTPIVDFGPKIEAKFGHSIGPQSTREVETVLRALPGTNQTYIVTWNEIWKVGTATVFADGKTFNAIYKIRTDILHQIETEAGVCP